MTRLIYTSRHKGLSAAVIDNILEGSRANNVRDVVTGALVVGEDSFLQLLEGSRSAIGRCFLRIMQDKRHQDIQIISCGAERRRMFQAWNMHEITAANIKKDILSVYLVNGDYNPGLLSEFAVQDLCWTLSKGNWSIGSERA